MIIGALFSWWYGAGWSRLGKNTVGRIDGALAFFSVGLLLKTLFDPFRQISAGRVRGPIGAQFRAWGDRQFSRGVGFVVRTTMIAFGLLVVGMLALVGLLQIIVWPLIPLLPIIGLLLTAIGWTP